MRPHQQRSICVGACGSCASPLRLCLPCGSGHHDLEFDDPAIKRQFERFTSFVRRVYDDKLRIGIVAYLRGTRGATDLPRLAFLSGQSEQQRYFLEVVQLVNIFEDGVVV